MVKPDFIVNALDLYSEGYTVILDSSLEMDQARCDPGQERQDDLLWV